MGVSYIGYKGFNKDLKGPTSNFQYEIGKCYEIDDEPSICEVGYHYCDNLIDVFMYCTAYDTRVCVVKAYGDIDYCTYVSCTNKIEILDEIEISKEDRIKYVYAHRYDLSFEELRKLLSKPFILDDYINDLNWRIRETVAMQGYGLDKLINDKDWQVREAVARQGYGLDILINDKDWAVRAAVARQGYSLDKLINDKNDFVRIVVAEQGYGLDKLINDPDEIVRNIALQEKRKG